MKKKLLWIFLIAFLIRLINLNQSLWLDEATTAKVVQHYNYYKILTKFSSYDFHPPLYYLFLKLWTNIFGYSEIALRMPSVLFSLMTGWIVYLIGGIWAAVFFLFNPLIVYYSQEARMYMMTTFFVTMALYFFLKLQKKSQSQISNLKSQIFFSLFIFLSLFTFYGSVFLISAFLVYFLYKKQYRKLLNTLFVVFIYFLVTSPLFYQQLINAKISLSNVTNWSYVLGKANLKNLLLIPVKFLIGRIDFYPKQIYYILAGIWTAFVISQMLKLKSQIYNLNRKSIYLFTYLFIFPLFLGFVVSFVTPLLQYFRFLYLIPIMAILLSFGLSTKAESQPTGFRWRDIFLLAGFIFFSLVYLLLPQFHREDWKSLVKSLPKDKPVYMIVSSSDPVKFYKPNLLINELRITDYKLKNRDILVIPYTADIYGFDYQKILQEKKFQLTGRKTFRGLVLEQYSKK